MSRALLCLALVATTLPLEAGAEEKTPHRVLTVVLSRDPQAASQAAQMRERIAARLNDEADYVIPEAWNDASAEETERLEVIARHIESAREALDNLEPAKVKEVVSLAEVLARDLPFTVSRGPRLELLEISALGAFYAGDLAGMAASLERLYTLNPEHRFDPMRVGPEVISKANEVKDKLSLSGRAHVEVQVKPVPGRVYVDGNFQGLSTLEVKNLAPGPHIITVEAIGFYRQEETVNVTPGSLATFTLEPDLSQVDRRVLQKELTEALDAGKTPVDVLEKAFDVHPGDVFLLVTVASGSGGEFDLSALAVNRLGSASATWTRRGAGWELMAAGVMERLMQETLGAISWSSAPEPEPEVEEPPGPPLLPPPSAEALVAGGAGIASAGLGVFFGLQANKHRALATSTTEPGGQLSVKPARTNAILANTAFVAGGIGVGAAVFLWARGTPDAEPLDDEESRVDAGVAPAVGEAFRGILVYGRF